MEELVQAIKILSDLVLKVESDNDRIISLLENINDTPVKEYLLNEEVELEFNLTRTVRKRLVSNGELTPIKLTGQKANTYWKRSEINTLFENKYSKHKSLKNE